jgi:hypothetical protein
MAGFSKIMRGQSKAGQLDQQFIENPTKEAESLPIRQGRDISDGKHDYIIFNTNFTIGSLCT